MSASGRRLIFACFAWWFLGDLVGVGRCMSEYWQLKKKMAPGCEPELVTCIMTALQPHVLGMSLAGAGGGGFMYLLTTNPHCIDLIRSILSEVKVNYTRVSVAVSLIHHQCYLSVSQIVSDKYLITGAVFKQLIIVYEPQSQSNRNSSVFV